MTVKVDRRLRQLQSRVPPQPGQTFSSYLAHLASSLNPKPSLVTLLYLTGVIDVEEVKAIGPGFGVDLTEQQIQNFAWTTRLEPAQVEAMLLSHYDGIALDLEGLNVQDVSSVRQVARDNWGFFSTTRICPQCIAENGAELLPWKLPLVFACTKHEVLLADTCPKCANPFSLNRSGGGSRPLFASMVQRPGFCLNAPAVGYAGAGRSAIPCLQPLAQMHVESIHQFPRLLLCQQQIRKVLNGQPSRVAGRTTSAIEYLDHLRSTTALLLYAALPEDLGELPPAALAAFGTYFQDREARLQEREDRRASGDRGGPALVAYRGVQRSAALMAAVVPTAVELLDTSTVGELADQLLPLIERAREIKRNKVRLINVDFSFEGPLEEAIDLALAPRAEFDRRLGLKSTFRGKEHMGEAYDFTSTHVPQLFWEHQFRRTFKPIIAESDMRDDSARRVLSMALVKLTGPLSWAQAATELKLPASSATGSANKFMGLIATLGRTNQFGLALHHVAAELAANPVRTDYDALRRRFDMFTEIDYDAWSVLATLSGVMPGKRGGKHRFAAAWVWASVTGGDFRLSPALGAGTSGAQRDQYARFLKEDFARIRPALAAFADNLLQSSEP